MRGNAKATVVVIIGDRDYFCRDPEGYLWSFGKNLWNMASRHQVTN